MDGNQEINITTRQIWKALSRPLKVILSLFGTVSIFGIISSISKLYDIDRELSKSNGAINAHLLIGLFVSAVLAIVCLSAIVAALLVSLLKIELNNRSLDQNIKKMEEVCSRLKGVTDTLSSMDNVAKRFLQDMPELIDLINTYFLEKNLSKYILNEEQITKLESSVEEDHYIYALTSEFRLESTKLVEVVLNNIRKGVIYQYLIPSKIEGSSYGKKHKSFCKILLKWWKRFLEDFEKHKKIVDVNEKNCFGEDYREILENAQKGMYYIDELQRYFLSHIKENIIADEYSIITVLLYQYGEENRHDYNVIIKLPTVTEENYYAFKAPDTREKTRLVDTIEELEQIAKNVSLKIEFIDNEWKIMEENHA